MAVPPSCCHQRATAGTEPEFAKQTTQLVRHNEQAEQQAEMKSSPVQKGRGWTGGNAGIQQRVLVGSSTDSHH